MAIDFYASAEDHSGNLWDLHIERYDLDTGEVLARSEPGLNRVANGGGVVVAATVDGRLVQLEADTLATIGLPFPGTNGIVRWLKIDNAGRRLMVVGQDGTMRFYYIATRTQLGDPISVDAGRIPSVALRDDGMAAAAVAGGGIVFWNLDPTNWEAPACRLAGRNLTRAEWTSTSATSRPTPPPARTIQPKPDNPTKTARPLRLCQTQAAPTTSTTASLNHSLS